MENLRLMLLLCVYLVTHTTYAVQLRNIGLTSFGKDVDTKDRAYDFEISDHKVTWENALELCRSRSKLLVTIKDSFKDYDVRSMLHSAGTFSIWTAANDLGSAGLYYWRTTNEPVRYTNWRSGFPDNGHTGCISVANLAACTNETLGNYGWDKQQCNKLLYAVCE